MNATAFGANAMLRTRIKFCGLTRLDDVHAAAALGVDAVGFVFTARSRRRVDVAAARELRRALPPFVAAVALFMDDTPAFVAEVVRSVRPDYAQFHGAEDAAHCDAAGCAYLKAIPMGADVDVHAYAAQYPRAAGFLLDSHAAGQAGGSGERFDWTRVPQDLRRPLLLAGGLTAGNVAAAVRIARPYAVDVSSGIESAPGIKDPAQMAAFVAAVRAGEAG